MHPPLLPALLPAPAPRQAPDTEPRALERLAARLPPRALPQRDDARAARRRRTRPRVRPQRCGRVQLADLGVGQPATGALWHALVCEWTEAHPVQVQQPELGPRAQPPYLSVLALVDAKVQLRRPAPLVAIGGRRPLPGALFIRIEPPLLKPEHLRRLRDFALHLEGFALRGWARGVRQRSASASTPRRGLRAAPASPARAARIARAAFVPAA